MSGLNDINFMSTAIDAAGHKALQNRQQQEDDDDEDKKNSWFQKIKQLLGYTTPTDRGMGT